MYVTTESELQRIARNSVLGERFQRNVHPLYRKQKPIAASAEDGAAKKQGPEQAKKRTFTQG
ncbi:hypothetical protein KTH_13860 [Thermosporothrix hazakensis]|jgi:hypothetical protein|uniref:Uncharacterized protein n=1 Tax=Thermosporothrix sp. COM3 TaxID=2490863 RepID=A0A455SM48_9CHLR|nr:hypothetical protein KTC_30820 [Thermosporothrix sp. COM3]GCE46517.1 hypothetical protein KTH_13860 [Thermosporothrix hazakensis]